MLQKMLIPATSLSVLHNDFNYFHKIIFLLCIAKNLDLLAKLFLPYIYSLFFLNIRKFCSHLIEFFILLLIFIPSNLFTNA